MDIDARMMRRSALLSGVALATLAAGGALPVRAADALTDADISDAYLYLLGRLLVLRQEILDFRDEGFKWNEVIYREPGGVAWANPNLDVAYSEAWVAVDENTPAVLDVPEIKGGRYYTWQMLNGWGETTVNINERSFKDHPFGKFAFVLQGFQSRDPGRRGQGRGAEQEEPRAEPRRARVGPRGGQAAAEGSSRSPRRAP